MGDCGRSTSKVGTFGRRTSKWELVVEEIVKW